MDYKQLLKVLKNAKHVYREDYVKKIFRSAHYDMGLFETQLNEFNETLKGKDSEIAKLYMDRTIVAQVINDASIILEIARDNYCLSPEQNQNIIEMIDTLDIMSENIEVTEEVNALAKMPENTQSNIRPTRKDKVFANV
ncbi:hypothetical protein V7O66_08350 [Methanolobus sp. ZRKC3]|uniref:hypothetical protein n=1 Tax=Methanolobus sp. ZRKC3 TaxID=3125786 RepID=UPI00324D07A1